MVKASIRNCTERKQKQENGYTAGMLPGRYMMKKQQSLHATGNINYTGPEEFYDIENDFYEKITYHKPNMTGKQKKIFKALQTVINKYEDAAKKKNKISKKPFTIE